MVLTIIRTCLTSSISVHNKIILPTFTFHYADAMLSILQQCLGSPVLGYLAAGILIGPYGLSIIRHVHATKAIAEFGVVFLLFNIGLEVWFPICSILTLVIIIIN